MPNENDNKLVTLADLGVAYDDLKTQATTTTAGMMSAEDKVKLNGIETGAQVNTVTGVKGDAESTYRQDNVNLTAANVGAVSKTGDTMTGPLMLDNTDRAFRAIYFNSNGTGTGWISTEDQTNVMQFLQLNPNVAGAFGLYQFPAADENSYSFYEILTTKSPVSVTQGGTGATSAPGARANIGAVSKTGDTMTGGLTLKNTSGDASQVLAFSNRTMRQGLITVNSGARMYFQEYTPNSSNNASEFYFLPTPTTTSENGVVYYVLTSKNPVTVAQGGTGATTPAGARANLHAMQNPDGSSPTYATGNFNDAPVGFSAWYGPSCVNAPFQTWVSVLTIIINVEFIQQIAFSWNGDQIAYRACGNGTWNTWKYITMS